VEVAGRPDSSRGRGLTEETAFFEEERERGAVAFHAVWRLRVFGKVFGDVADSAVLAANGANVDDMSASKIAPGPTDPALGEEGGTTE